ncbi:MAG: iron ABC transporter permease [Bermanella sp.]
MNARFSHRRRFNYLCVFCAVLLLVSIPLTIALGTINIHPEQVLKVILAHLSTEASNSIDIAIGIDKIIWELRVPRVLIACITGAGLAMAGLTLQAVTRNSLADPHLLGISAGAVLGAVIVTMHVGDILGPITLPLAAFCGSLLATALIALVSQTAKLSSATHLLMTGVALSFVLISAANLALFLGDHRASHQVIFWMLGGLGLARWSTLLLPFLVCTFGYLFLHFHTKYINALLLGDETATSLGVNVKRLRIQLFVVSALITAVLVANSGAIGFVGLMIPHIARYFVGGDNRRLLPFCALLGALFLPWVDVIARSLLAPEELPIGIITGFIGGLFFIVLLIRSSR